MPGLLVARRFLPEGCRARVGCQLHKARVGCHPRQATNIAKAIRTEMTAVTLPEINLYPHGLLSLSAEHNPGGKMENTLKGLGTIEITGLEGPSAYVRPQSVFYELHGRKRRWDMVKSHSSVGVVCYHTALDSLLVVRQFRPAVYAARLIEARAEGKEDPPLAAGFTFELCAGIIDKNKSLEEIAQEEVEEECGYKVKVENISPVVSYQSSMGISGSRHSMFHVEVDESMRVSGGGGLESTGEAIEVLALPLSNARAFMADDGMTKSAGLLFALMWLLDRKAALAKS